MELFDKQKQKWSYWQKSVKIKIKFIDVEETPQKVEI